MFKHKSQAGVSLVSLIIGVGLSAFLTVVLLQVFSSSRSSYAVAENIVEMDDAMNFMVSTMTNIVPLAGYRSPPADGEPLIPLNSALPGNNNIQNANAFAGMYVMPYNSGGKDGFIIAHQGNSDGSIKDCNGAMVGVYPDVAYLIFKQEAATGGGNNLWCERYGANKKTEIVSKVLDQFWVRYGEDTDDDGQINRYVTAAQQPDFLKVRAIQVAILLRSSKEAYPANTKFEYSQWGVYQFKNDKYSYKFMTFTFQLPHPPDPSVTASQGGTLLTDSVTSKAILPFSPYVPPDTYFKNTKTFTGNSVTHNGSMSAADGTVVYVAPFVDANSLNANKEIYVEYTVGNRGLGANSQFCYFFRGINNSSPGDSDANKFCFQNVSSVSKWYKYGCSSQDVMSIVEAGAAQINNGDIIGMSIKFPASMVAGQNVITRLYRNGIKLYEEQSNGTPCQGKWDAAMSNKEKVVFTVGKFWGTSGLMQITINKPPKKLPPNALPLK